MHVRVWPTFLWQPDQVVGPIWWAGWMTILNFIAGDFSLARAHAWRGPLDERCACMYSTCRIAACVCMGWSYTCGVSDDTTKFKILIMKDGASGTHKRESLFNLGSWFQMTVSRRRFASEANTVYWLGRGWTPGPATWNWGYYPPFMFMSMSDRTIWTVRIVHFISLSSCGGYTRLPGSGYPIYAICACSFGPPNCRLVFTNILTLLSKRAGHCMNGPF